VGAEVRAGRLCVSRALTRKTVMPDDVLVFLPSDTSGVAFGPLLVSFLRFARKPTATAFSPQDLAKLPSTALKKPFASALDGWVKAGALPPGVGAVWHKDSRLLFLLEDLVSSAPASHAPHAAVPNHSNGLAARFSHAFDQLNEQSGRENYVSLYALRRALDDVPRAEFDACLRALRREQRFTLDASDGRHHRLTDEERDAGISEAGNLLVYVARKR
jgi:hypothetical protein